MGMSAIWTGGIMTLYFGYVIAEFLPYAKYTSLIAILLWGWGVATSSIQYIQQREIMSPREIKTHRKLTESASAILDLRINIEAIIKRGINANIIKKNF